MLPSNATDSTPIDLNQAGQVIGHYRQRDPTTGYYLGLRGFVWSSAGGAVDIGSLFPGDSFPRTYPFAVSNHGQAVGYSGSNNNMERAFPWTQATGIIDLNTRLSNAPAGLVPYYGIAISDNGSIVAYGTTGLVLLKLLQAAPPPAAPALGPIAANDPVPLGTAVSVSAAFTDINPLDTHAAQWQWGDGTGNSAGSVSESAGAGSATGTHVFGAAGVYSVSATVTDSSGRAASVRRDVVVYDPSAGFVIGGGWINSPMGAYKADSTLAGRATFGFVSKYKKGATLRTGETESQFQAARLNFHSSTYEWLVVAGARAQYKGVGDLNGRPGYKFLLSAVDGALLAKGTPDRFRIKIWHFDSEQNADVVDYDNQIDASFAGTNSEGTAIAGGSIVVHK